MRNKGKSRGYIEYKLSVSYHASDLKVILCVIEMYKRAVIPGTFEISENRVIEVKATSIISNINLTFDSSNWRADRDEIAAIEDRFRSKQKKKPKKCSSTDYSAYAENQIDVSGALKTTVIPSLGSGNRRSKRVRTVITHLSELK